MSELKCLNCGKPNANGNNRDWEDGIWLCLDCRKIAKVPVKCTVCGAEFGVRWDTYRMKDPSKPWRCRKCNDKFRREVYDAKSPEEKGAFVASQTARSKAYWANRSEEEIKADSERRKKLWEKRFATGDLSALSGLVAGREKWWNSLSDEEKQARWEILNEGRDKWWNTLSPEEKEAHMKYPHEGWKDMYDAFTEEERIEFMYPLHQGRRKFFDNMTDEEYDNWYKQTMKGVQAHYDSMTEIDNKPEADFANKMNAIGVEYKWQYPSTVKHPKFDEYFHENPIIGKSWNPYHFWDFMVKTKNGNILVDIDGSHHFVKVGVFQVNGFDVGRYHLLKDSQRLYQTDGMDAYVIQCKDDILVDTTPVVNVKTNEELTFKDLITRIQWMNMDKKDQQEALRS